MSRGVEEVPTEISRARALIACFWPYGGGVQRMVEFACDALEGRGIEPVLAYYEPYRESPELSTPLFALPFRRPRSKVLRTESGHEAHAIGAWLPELEFTHFHLTRPWSKAIESCQYHLVVSGNCLAATALVDSGRKFLGWIATAWEDDRQDRVRRFPLPRRLLDQFLVSPITRRLERKILHRGDFAALSQHTAGRVHEIGERQDDTPVLRIPIDCGLFRPDADAVKPARIGFSGRLDDPRKNLGLLVQATGVLADERDDLELFLFGGPLASEIDEQIAASGLMDRVTIFPYMSPGELAPLLRTLDVFVVPSHQEGLCIAALEAMASGCPVVSTRCGGPEEFVREGRSGFLVDEDPRKMASSVRRILEDRSLRGSLSRAARELVVRKYSRTGAREAFWNLFSSCFSGGSQPSTEIASPSAAAS